MTVLFVGPLTVTRTLLSSRFARDPMIALPTPSSDALRSSGSPDSDNNTTEMLPVVARHGFSARELAAWDAWRDSPQGRRGIGASEIEEALYQVGDQLTEVSSGQPWGWPLARVARLADAHGFSAELDAAFEKTLGRGAASPPSGQWLYGFVADPASPGCCNVRNSVSPFAVNSQTHTSAPMGPLMNWRT